MNRTSRRDFLKMASLAGIGAFTGFSAAAFEQSELRRITILHTNDTHSRIDPYPANDPNYPGMGGYARRAALVKHYRRSDPGLLLLDAGDIFQGTPYYNMYGGEAELKLMSHMGYDAATIGNHEFDNGIDGLRKVLPNASFPFVCSNYDFSDTILQGLTIPNLVLERNDIVIGIYGLGIDPAGLVGSNLTGNTRYLDPIEVAREMETELRQKKRCELIICLSHLGFRYDSDRVSDYMVAQNTRFTDIIIGGHTHRRLDPPEVAINLEQQPVYIGQAGSGGVYLGQMEVVFETASNKKSVASYTTKIFEKQEV